MGAYGDFIAKTEVGMRRVPLIFVVALSCSSSTDEGPATMGALETNATSYVAAPITAGVFDYGVTVQVKLRNTGEEILRISRCLPTTAHPPYWVEKAPEGDAAWSPNLECAPQGPTIADLRPGEERTDTLQLRAPWLKTFNGQPVGAIEGQFYLVYETRVCRSISVTGVCSPVNAVQYARSNHFRVSTQ